MHRCRVGRARAGAGVLTVGEESLSTTGFMDNCRGGHWRTGRRVSTDRAAIMKVSPSFILTTGFEAGSRGVHRPDLNATRRARRDPLAATSQRRTGRSLSLNEAL